MQSAFFWHATALAVLLLATHAPARADVFEPGDIVVAGDRIVDGFGNRHGCIYRIRGGQITRWFESNQFRYPTDTMIDSQGRLVFLASPLSRNYNDSALFRLDPASGTLERLWYFPYIPAVGDTLPDGAQDATSFYGTYQSLHLEKSFSIEINDDENGGWPQVSSPECYGFSIGSTFPSGARPTAYRYRPDTGRCEVGTDVSLLLPWTAPPYMAQGGGDIYYGLNNVVCRTTASARVSLHLDGQWGTLDASLTANPRNEIWVAGSVFDNTFIPNGSASCGPLQDDNVPWAAVGGSSFSVLSMNGLGVIDGALYATSNSLATGVPYVFSLANRAPYLNPYSCTWYTASQGYGPLPFWLEDGTPTGSRLTSPDGGGLLGQDGGIIRSIQPTGDYSMIVSSSGDIALTGRPCRWSAPSSMQPVGPSKTDTGAQVLVLRADALVDVLLTDPLGRRIGFDAAGQAVNDLGATAQALQLGAGGWPRLVIVRDPEVGVSTVDVHAPEACDWTVTAYLAHPTDGGLVRAASGSAAGAGTDSRGLALGNPLGLAWYQSTTAADAIESTDVRFSAGPVPSRGVVHFSFRAPVTGARVRLSVFDVRGRRVAVPLRDVVLAGSQQLRWDGSGADGRRLAAGVYLARLELDGRASTRRIVLAR